MNSHLFSNNEIAPPFFWKKKYKFFKFQECDYGTDEKY